MILVPDDYNQIEEKEEKKTFVNSLWADSANNPVMSSKLICVFQTENQQSKSEVKYLTSSTVLVKARLRLTPGPRWYKNESLPKSDDFRRTAVKPTQMIHLGHLMACWKGQLLKYIGKNSFRYVLNT